MIYLKRRKFFNKDKNSNKDNSQCDRKVVKDDNQIIPLPTKDDLWFLPLGGSGEIGMNVNLYGTDEHWIMVDLGISFGDTPSGVNFMTANLDILKRNNFYKHIKGLIITHAHEDHIGGVHEIWPHFKFHVYVTKFSKEVLLKKLEGKPYADEMKEHYIHEMAQFVPFNVGNFTVEFRSVTHSIPEANVVWIKTPHGNILHTGDWKIDPTPVIGDPIDADKFKELAQQKVSWLISDSTNVFKPGRSGSENDVAKVFQRLFSQKQYRRNRIVCACFASNVARIKSMADAARQVGRKVCLLGRSIHKMTEAADRAQYPIHLDSFIDEREAQSLKPHELCYICTGSQGDENAALARMARCVHRLKLSHGDTVFFSSMTIPGNERDVAIVMNNLVRMGLRIVTLSQEKIHVSGHPCRDEIKDLYAWVEPEFVIPVHGESRHLIEQVNLAKSVGIPGLAPENGAIVNLVKKKIVQRLDIGRWCFDGNRFIDFGSSIIKERTLMGSDGTVFATIMINKQEKRLLKSAISVSFSGLIDDKPDEIKEQMETSLRTLLNTAQGVQGSQGAGAQGEGDSAVGKHIFEESEGVRTQKVVERIQTIMRSKFAKQPKVMIHWIYP